VPAQRRERRQAPLDPRAQVRDLDQDHPGHRAWVAVRVKTSYLRAQFLRIKARRGAKKAILAVAASMLTAAYHMLRDGTEYNRRDRRASRRPTMRCDARAARASLGLSRMNARSARRRIGNNYAVRGPRSCTWALNHTAA
jgi:hypothetical protein